MKRKLPLLLLASCSTALLAGVANAGDVTVYGKGSVNYNSIKIDGVPAVDSDGDPIQDPDQWDLSSAASRLGFKGSEDITDNLKAIFKLEFEVSIDGDDNSETLKRRNSYVGLQGNWGTIIAGNHDTPLKLSQGEIDLFNDLRYADIANIFVGENRDNDIVMYTTPKFLGNFAATVGITPGEPDDSQKDSDNGPADSVSSTVYYSGEQLYAAIAYDSNVNANDIIRATTTYNIGNWALGAMYQYAEESKNDEGLGKVIGLVKLSEDYYGLDYNEMEGGMLSLSYTLNHWVFKGQSAIANYENNNGNTDVNLTTVGVDYKFTENTKLYSYYTYSKMDKSDDLGIATDLEANVVGTIGLEVKF